jgi:hypothetical protein
LSLTDFISIAGGILISIVFYDDLMAAGERIGTVIGETIIRLILGERCHV